MSQNKLHILPYLNRNAVHTIYSLYTTLGKNKTKHWEKNQKQ